MTDHDTIGGTDEAIQTGKRLGVHLRESVADPLGMQDLDYGVKEEKKSRMVQQYEYDMMANGNTEKTEILFLELMYNCLTVGGRCGVVVPQGILFGSSNAHKRIRKKLLEECRLDMVISMPSGVFKPYAGVATGILIFTKGESTDKVLTPE